MDAGPSAAVVELADRFRATLAGNFSTLHLRRSDALTHKAQKRKRCGTKVSTVKTYVDCVYPPPRCGPTRCKSKADAERRDTLVVFTDERDQRYLDDLYDALKSTGRDLCGNQPVRRVLERRRTGIATPSSRHRVDGVEDDAMIQHERAVKF